MCWTQEKGIAYSDVANPWGNSKAELNRAQLAVLTTVQKRLGLGSDELNSRDDV